MSQTRGQMIGGARVRGRSQTSKRPPIQNGTTWSLGDAPLLADLVVWEIMCAVKRALLNPEEGSVARWSACVAECGEAGGEVTVEPVGVCGRPLRAWGPLVAVSETKWPRKPGGDWEILLGVPPLVACWYATYRRTRAPPIIWPRVCDMSRADRIC